MSHLPEKGEVWASAEALDARLRAAAPDGDRWATATVDTNSGDMRGDEMSVRAAYGDLYDIAEVAEHAQGPVSAFIYDIARGIPPDAVMRSMWMLAMAQGVLMERARWER